MTKQHMIKRIGKYELWTELLNFGKESYMFSVIYNGNSIETMESAVIGTWNTKKELIKNINDFIARYTDKQGNFHPFTVSEY